MSKERLVGTWRLVKAAIQPEDGGPPHFPYGEKAIGRIIYDAAGNMAGQVFSLGRERFAEKAGGTLDEIKTAFRGMVSYFGTYSVDEDEGVVTHHVEGSYIPNWEGGQQVRLFSFDDEGHLILSTPPMSMRGVTGVFALTWERVCE